MRPHGAIPSRSDHTPRFPPDQLAPVTVLGPALAERHLGGAAAWGVISASLGLGAVGGQFGAGRVRAPRRPGVAIAALMPVMTAEALAGPAAVAIGAHAFLTGSAVIMAAAGAVFAFLPALRVSPREAAE